MRAQYPDTINIPHFWSALYSTARLQLGRVDTQVGIAKKRFLSFTCQWLVMVIN